MAFFNEDGIVQAGEPYEELPRRLIAGLERFLLVPDGLTSSNRILALGAFLDEWTDLADDQAVAQWLEQHGDAEVRMEEQDDADWDRASGGGGSPRFSVVLAGDFLKLLIEEVLEQTAADRIGRIISIASLTSEWYALWLEDEQLIGHLLRAHALQEDIRWEEGDDLMRRHADLHRELAGAPHPPPPVTPLSHG